LCTLHSTGKLIGALVRSRDRILVDIVYVLQDTRKWALSSCRKTNREVSHVAREGYNETRYLCFYGGTSKIERRTIPASVYIIWFGVIYVLTRC